MNRSLEENGVVPFVFRRINLYEEKMYYIRLSIGEKNNIIIELKRMIHELNKQARQLVKEQKIYYMPKFKPIIRKKVFRKHLTVKEKLKLYEKWSQPYREKIKLLKNSINLKRREVTMLYCAMQCLLRTFNSLSRWVRNQEKEQIQFENKLRDSIEMSANSKEINNIEEQEDESDYEESLEFYKVNNVTEFKIEKIHKEEEEEKEGERMKDSIRKNFTSLNKNIIYTNSSKDQTTSPDFLLKSNKRVSILEEKNVEFKTEELNRDPRYPEGFENPGDLVYSDEDHEHEDGERSFLSVRISNKLVNKNLESVFLHTTPNYETELSEHNDLDIELSSSVKINHSSSIKRTFSLIEETEQYMDSQNKGGRKSSNDVDSELMVTPRKNEKRDVILLERTPEQKFRINISPEKEGDVNKKDSPSLAEKSEAKALEIYVDSLIVKSNSKVRLSSNNEGNENKHTLAEIIEGIQLDLWQRIFAFLPYSECLPIRLINASFNCRILQYCTRNFQAFYSEYERETKIYEETKKKFSSELSLAKKCLSKVRVSDLSVLTLEGASPFLYLAVAKLLNVNIIITNMENKEEIISSINRDLLKSVFDFHRKLFGVNIENISKEDINQAVNFIGENDKSNSKINDSEIQLRNFAHQIIEYWKCMNSVTNISSIPKKRKFLQKLGNLLKTKKLL